MIFKFLYVLNIFRKKKKSFAIGKRGTPEVKLQVLINSNIARNKNYNKERKTARTFLTTARTFLTPVSACMSMSN